MSRIVLLGLIVFVSCCDAQTDRWEARANAVVQVVVQRNGEDAETASGIILSNDNGVVRVLTCEHLIRNISGVRILFQGDPQQPITARVLSSGSSDLDLAVLQTSAPLSKTQISSLQKLNWASRDSIAKDMLVKTISGDRLYPTNRVYDVSHDTDVRFFEYNPSGIAPGFSGGPVFDDSGNLIGMQIQLSSHRDAQVSVAIAVDTLLRTLEAIGYPVRNLNLLQKVDPGPRVLTEDAVVTRPTLSSEKRHSPAVERALPLIADENYSSAITLLAEAAGHGDGEAATQVGIILEEAHDPFTRNVDAAAEWYKLATKLRDPRGYARLGNLTFGGVGGVAKDDFAAESLFRRSAEGGDGEGLCGLAMQRFLGTDGYPRDDTETVRLLTLAANQNAPCAQNNLAEFYVMGKAGLTKDQSKGLRLLHQAIDQGYPSAMATLGYFYLLGEAGLIQDDLTAATWLKKAASYGDSGGINAIGDFYLSGFAGFPRDRNKARSYYQQAIDLGDCNAMGALSDMLGEEHHGDPKYYEQIFSLDLRAASLGCSGGLIALADIYAYGTLGKIPDGNTALKFLKRAEDQGSTFAFAVEGTFYDRGVSDISPDHTKALALLKRSVESGDLFGEFILGTAYRDGTFGLKVDVPNAINHFQAGAAKNFLPSVTALGITYAGRQDRFGEAKTLLDRAASHGDLNALALSGAGYLGTGTIFPHDDGKAKAFLTEASFRLDPYAMQRWGTVLLNGSNGQPQNIPEGMRLLQGAAEQGDLEALVSLGNIYEQGLLGFDRNLDTALNWYLKAAGAGDPSSMGSVSYMYYFPSNPSTKPNYAEAAKWSAKVKDSDNPDAQVVYGMLEFWGQGGVPWNQEDAVLLFKKAAAKDEIMAMVQLADILYLGLAHQKKDRDTAKYWYRRAQRAGYKLSTMEEGFLLR